MKSPLSLIALLFSASFIFAQVQLEHTYPKGSLSRVRMDQSGERYLLRNQDNISGSRVNVYNANHSDTGTDFLLFPTSTPNVVTNVFVSEKMVDEDPEMEIVFFWNYDGEKVFFTEVMQASGERSWFACLRFSEIEGLEPKLICTPRVFGLPSLLEEHSFSDLGCTSGNCDIDRMLFPLDGERYLIRKHYTSDYHVFDGDFNKVKTITPPAVSNNYSHNFTQTLFNDDALLEVFGTRGAPADAAGNAYVFTVAQENGAVLFSRACLQGTISNLPNLPARIIVHQYIAPGELETQIFDAKTFAQVLSLPGKMMRVSPDGISEYYFSDKLINNTLVVYNVGTATTKTLQLEGNVIYFSAQQFAKGWFANDGDLELFYLVTTDPQNPRIVWKNEDGQLLKTFPATRHLPRLDAKAGMPDKLLVSYGLSGYIDSTQVYRRGAGTSTFAPDAQMDVRVSPNPFFNQISLEFPVTGKYDIRLADTYGNTVLTARAEAKSEVLHVGSNLPAGIYFLNIRGESGQKTLKMVKGR